eukprot:gene14888-18695_t
MEAAEQRASSASSNIQAENAFSISGGVSIGAAAQAAAAIAAAPARAILRGLRDFIVIYDYNPATAVSPRPLHVHELYDALPEHTLREGDVVTVDFRDRRAADGYHVGKLRGVVGLVPTAFIEPVAGATEFVDGGRVRAALLRDSRLYNAPHIGMHASSSASQQSGAYQRAGKFEGGRRGATQFWLGRARFAHNAARSSSHVMSLGAEKPLLSFECGDLFTAVEAKLRPDGLMLMRNARNQVGLVPANFLETVRAGQQR